MVSAFKSALRDDLDVFINVEEFADEHVINGVTVKAVFDSSVANRFQEAQIQGVFQATSVVYLRQGDLDPLPQIDADITIDGLHFRVKDVVVEQGVDILTLEAYEQ